MAITDFDVYLEDVYGLDYTKGVSQLGDIFTVGTNAQRVEAAAAVFPWWVAYCCCDSSRAGLGIPDRVPTPGAPQWSDVQILQCSYAVAAHNDAIWATGGGIGQGWYFGALPLSRARIIWPHGSYYINYPLILNFGQYLGMGSANSAPDLNSPVSQVSGGTRLSLWHEEWLDVAGYDNGPVKHIFQSLNWPCSVGGTLYVGVLGASGGQATNIMDTYYMEGCVVEGFRFDGRKSMAPEAVDGGNTYVTTYEDAGIAIFRMGSVSEISKCLGDGFNNAAFCLASGVPSTIFNIRAFHCNYAAVWFRGKGTFTITGIEVDDCPTVFKATQFLDPSDAGHWLLTPGAKLTANGVKVETGVTGSAALRKGTMLFDGIGWCRSTISGVDYASANIYPELLCRIEPFPTGFTSTSSYLKVDGLLIFNFVRTLMHHVQTGNNKKWFVDKGEYTTKFNSSTGGFVYNSANGGTLSVDSGNVVAMKLVPYGNRQKWITLPLGVQQWDDTVNPGTPVYDNPAS
ncbi:MAG TPA: hypothetical protein PLP28_07125 [Flavobacteriales bacterium]|nr:hypothetical protein [Flavobacteriales bacterium]